MVDLKALQAELEQARKVRQEAERIGGDLEDLVSEMRRVGLDFRFDPDERRPSQTRH
jgi:hypothetical protein